MLLMSGSKYKNTEYLAHTIKWLKGFLADYKGKKIAFLPYAGVSRSYDEYEQVVQDKFAELELEVVSVHQAKNIARLSSKRM